MSPYNKFQSYFVLKEYINLQNINKVILSINVADIAKVNQIFAFIKKHFEEFLVFSKKHEF